MFSNNCQCLCHSNNCQSCLCHSNNCQSCLCPSNASRVSCIQNFSSVVMELTTVFEDVAVAGLVKSYIDNIHDTKVGGGGNRFFLIIFQYLLSA